MRLRSIAVTLLCAAVLGPATCMMADYVTSLFPYSERRDAIRDAFSIPGGLLAAMFYPQGIHTGMGSPSYPYVAVGANWLFWAAMWFLTIRLCVVFARWAAARKHGRPETGSQ